MRPRAWQQDLVLYLSSAATTNLDTRTSNPLDKRKLALVIRHHPLCVLRPDDPLELQVVKLGIGHPARHLGLVDIDRLFARSRGQERRGHEFGVKVGVFRQGVEDDRLGASKSVSGGIGRVSKCPGMNYYVRFSPSIKVESFGDDQERLFPLEEPGPRGRDLLVGRVPTRPHSVQLLTMLAILDYPCWTHSEIAANEILSIFLICPVTRTKSKYDGTTIRVFELLTADFINAGRVVSVNSLNLISSSSMASSPRRRVKTCLTPLRTWPRTPSKSVRSTRILP